jgi:hypothetical protein
VKRCVSTREKVFGASLPTTVPEELEEELGMVEALETREKVKIASASALRLEVWEAGRMIAETNSPVTEIQSPVKVKRRYEDSK